MAKKLTNEILDLTKAHVGVGVGAMALGGISAKSPTPVMQGMTTMTGMMPTVTTGVMGLGVARLAQRSFQRKKQRRR